MANALGSTPSVLALSFVLRLFFVVGFAIGIIAVPFYAIQQIYSAAFNPLALLAVIVAAPFVNGFFSAFAGLIGYPLYVFLARRNLFRLNQIAVR